jgi:hypothetical protein
MAARQGAQGMLHSELGDDRCESRNVKLNHKGHEGHKGKTRIIIEPPRRQGRHENQEQ